MRNDTLLYLMHEVRQLQKKYEATHNGQIRDKLKKKEAILDHMLSQEIKPTDPQQKLFEAK